LFKIFSSAGRVFEGTSDQLRQRLRLPRTASQTQPPHTGAQRDSSPDPTRAYRELAQNTRTQKPSSEPPQGPRTVASLMSSPPVTISILQNLGDAWQLMERHDVAQLPVMGQARQLVGMLSRTEVLKCLMVRNGEISFVSGQPIAQIMRQPVVAVHESEDVRQAALLMLDQDLNAMPVINNRDQLTGMLSRHDILGFLANARPLMLRA
jgi:acetoin utilization protein AcuB